MEKNSSTRVSRSTMPTRMAAWGLAVVAIVTMAGCGGLLKIGYKNGDTTGLFIMNRYLDLSSEQKEFVKPRLRALLAWHKSTQLPDYSRFATELQKKAQAQTTPAEVAALREQSRRRAYATIDHALPAMADIALHLTSDNIQTLQDKFGEEDDKWSEENLTGDLEKRQKARYDKTLDRVEEWYGRFSKAQRAEIRKLSDARPLDNGILFAERQRREQDLITMLNRVARDKPPRDAVIAMMKTYEEHFEQAPDPDRRAFIDSLHRTTDEMNAAIQNLATPQQRAKAVAKLQEWIDDFRSLSGEAD
ncbi:MAG: DUF6279 family lipoprotein [Burkholderiaceae bacterium]